MKACDLFSQISPGLGTEIVRYLRTDLRDVYRATLATLAKNKKLRLEFVQKKTGDQQIAWMLDALRLKINDEVGHQILQVWLMKAEAPMLITFLDALEIAHDGSGAIDGDFPDDFDASKLQGAITALLDKHPAEKATVYLRAFQLQRPGGWPVLAAAIDAEPRLRLGA